MSEHEVNPEPIGDPEHRIVVDRNSWRPGNTEDEPWNVAIAHRHDETSWANRFDVYVLESELSTCRESLRVCVEALTRIYEQEVILGQSPLWVVQAKAEAREALAIVKGTGK